MSPLRRPARRRPADLRRPAGHRLPRRVEHVPLLPAVARPPASSTRRRSRRSCGRPPAVATIDDDRGLGLATSHDAMASAIERARTCGVGSVAVTNSGHFGAAAYWASMALDHDMVGLAVTIGGLQVAPTHGARAMVGLNPIAFAAPAGEEAPFVFDGSMSSVAGNKIRIARRLGAKVAAWLDRQARRHADHGALRRTRGLPHAAAGRHPRDRLAQGLQPGGGGRHPGRRALRHRARVPPPPPRCPTTSPPGASTRSGTPPRSRPTWTRCCGACASARPHRAPSGCCTPACPRPRRSPIGGSAASPTTGDVVEWFRDTIVPASTACPRRI